MIKAARTRASQRRDGWTALAWRWALVGVAVLGAALVHLGDLWAGIALWVAAVALWQVFQAASLWRALGLRQRLRGARRDRREAGHR